MESRNEFVLKEKNGVSLWLYVTTTRIRKVEFYLSKVAMGTQNDSKNQENDKEILESQNIVSLNDNK